MIQNAVEVDNVTMRFNLATQKVDSLKEYVIKMFKKQLDVHDILAQDTVGVGPVVLVRLARVHQQRQDAGLVIFHW